MAQEAELRIKHDSVEKTTSAIDALISKLDQLDKEVAKTTNNNDKQRDSQNKLNTALKAAEIARKKAVDMLGLHQQGLHKLSDAYATEQAAIKAREVAAKKGIETGSKEYDILLNNIKETELATTASKRLAAEQAQKAAEMTKSQKAAELEALAQGKQTAAEKAQEKALASSNIARETATRLLKLEEKGLDRLSDEYAEARGEILGIEKAKQKGLKTGSAEYNQIVKNTKATEQSTAARKRLQRETAKSTKGADRFTNSLDDMAKQASLVDGPLGGIASRLTTFSGIIKGLGLGVGVAVAGAAAAIGVLGYNLSKGISVAADSEVQMKTLEEQVRSTGFAAGTTAEQLDIMARKIAMSTLSSTQGVRASIASLLSYTNVSGDIFERTIKKAEDIAIVQGKGTSEVVKKLGKTLENPVRYAKELAEWGIEFSDSQETAIKNAVSQKDIYQAQTIVLDAVSAKFGEVATAQGDATFSGSVDSFNQKWEELFETLSNKILPALKDVVDRGADAVDFLRDFSETDIQTSTREFKESLSEAAKEVGGYQKLLEKVKKEYEDLYKTTDDGNVKPQNLSETIDLFRYLSQTASSGILKDLTGIEITPDTDYLPELAKQLEILKEKEVAITAEIEAQKKSSEERASQRSADQEKYLKELSKEVSDQKELTELFLKHSDTREEGYRKAKARIDAENAAKKKGLDVDDAAIALIEKEFKELSDLTEKRVNHNTILQKTKSLQSQQDGLKREVELYKATTQGILKNSEAYIQLSASIKTANEIKRMSGEVTSDQAKALYQENVELLKAQRNQAVLNALKASNSNSANVATLDRQIELQKMVAKGVEKTSSEYIYEEERLKALNTIKTNAIAVDSEEYKQLLKNAEAIAAKRSELQKFQDIADAGIVFDSLGKSQIEGSLKQLTSSLSEGLVKLDDLVDTDSGISQEMIDKLKETLKADLRDEKNEILIPLGLFVDSEGAVQVATELSLLQEELREKEKELKALWQEEDLISEEQYLERRKQLILDYEEDISSARSQEWESTASYKSMILTREIADQAAAGTEALSVVAGNNKKLAKISKTASMFSASVGLVDLLSSISSDKTLTYYGKIAAYAGAAAQGASIISMASGLNEPSFAFGGVDIQGAGTGRSDSIKANIARGESVMTAPATAKYKDTLERMNAGLPVRQGGGSSFTSSPIINIQGDASERTVGLIEMRLRDYEERVQQIAQGVSQQTIQEENEVGGFLNPI